MGRYFGREPRYSQEEAEAQAKQAIEAAVSKGRPPDEDWKPLAPRMADINRELSIRPQVEIPPPPARRRVDPDAGGAESARPRRPMNQILRPPAPPAGEPPPPKRATGAAKPPAAGGAKRPSPKKRPG